MAADAVADDVDEFGRAAFAVEVLGLVPRRGDVLEDRVLGAEPGLDMGQRLVQQVRDLALPVDRAYVAPGGVELGAQGLAVLDRPVAGLFGGELRVGEAAAVDQVLQFDLGRDLGGLDVGVQRADEHVDRLVGGAQVDLAVGRGQLDEQFEVELAALVAPAGTDGAVDAAEPAIGGADVDQVVEDPAGDLGVLVGGPAGRLERHERQQPRDHLVVIGAGVEVHRDGDLVDRVQGDLGHLVDRGVRPVQLRLARVEVVQGRCAGQRLEAAGQPLVGQPHPGQLVVSHSRPG